eukprot:1149099-Pelagomonas_calceolata.AAC.3
MAAMKSGAIEARIEESKPICKKIPIVTTVVIVRKMKSYASGASPQALIKEFLIKEIGGHKLDMHIGFDFCCKAASTIGTPVQDLNTITCHARLVLIAGARRELKTFKACTAQKRVSLYITSSLKCKNFQRQETRCMLYFGVATMHAFSFDVSNRACHMGASTSMYMHCNGRPVIAFQVVSGARIPSTGKKQGACFTLVQP